MVPAKAMGRGTRQCIRTGCHRGDGERYRDVRVCDDIKVTSAFSRATSVQRSSTSLEGGGGAIAATEDGAASRTLSARVASSSRLLESPEEASTIRTLGDRRWRKSSWKIGPSAAAALSPSNCWIRQSSCVGQRSPNSTEWKSCCSLRCSGTAVHLMSCCLRVS